MRVAVMGAGAIGSMVGGRLSRYHDVTLIARKPHVEAIGAHGLELTGETEMTVDVEARTDTAGMQPVDVCFLTVKAYQTEQALADAAGAIDEHTYLVSLQNGLGNLETVTEVVPGSRAVGGTTSHGCIFHGPGRVEHTGVGDTIIGPPSPPDLPAHHELADALTEAGIETDVVADIQPRLWAKAAVNAAINPLTAITGLPNGALVDLGDLEELLVSVARETEDVARANGIGVDPDAWVDQARTVAKRTADNRSSMLQDVQRGQRTEIDAICGRIAEVAEEQGVGAPLNRALHALVRGIEATLTYDG